MQVDSVGAVLEPGNAATQRIGIQQEDFLKILLAQLSFQDPLEPLDNQEYIAQLAQFTTLEQSRQTSEGIDALLSLQSTNQAISLLGQEVEVSVEGGTTLGTVRTTDFQRGVPLLTVEREDGGFITDVNLSQILVVRKPQEG